jgi:hypothetical protein
LVLRASQSNIFGNQAFQQRHQPRQLQRLSGQLIGEHRLLQVFAFAAQYVVHRRAQAAVLLAALGVGQPARKDLVGRAGGAAPRLALGLHWSCA